MAAVPGLLLVGVLVACGGDESADAQPAATRSLTATSTSPAADPVAAARAEAREAYLGMWRDYVVAARAPDFESPLLSRHAAGNAHALLVQGLAEKQRKGVVTRGEPQMDPEVVSLTPEDDPTSAKIVDCLDTTRWLNYDADSGELEDDEPGGLHRVTATLSKLGGAWKVTELRIEGRGTC